MSLEHGSTRAGQRGVYARAASASCSAVAQKVPVSAGPSPGMVRLTLDRSPAQLERAFDDLAADALSGRRELLGRADPATEQPSDLAAGQAEFGDVGGRVVGRGRRPCGEVRR